MESSSSIRGAVVASIALALAGCSSHSEYENVRVTVGDREYRATVGSDDAAHRRVLFANSKDVILGGGPEYDTHGHPTGRRLQGLTCEDRYCRGWDSYGREWLLDYQDARPSYSPADSEMYEQALPPEDLKRLEAQARWCVPKTLCVDVYNGSGWQVRGISILLSVSAERSWKFDQPYASVAPFSASTVYVKTGFVQPQKFEWSFEARGFPPPPPPPPPFLWFAPKISPGAAH